MSFVSKETNTMTNPEDGDPMVVFLRYLVATRGDQLLMRWLLVLYGHNNKLFVDISELMRILLTQPLHLAFDQTGTYLHLYASLSPFITVSTEDLDEKTRGVFRSLYRKRHMFDDKYCRQLAMYVDFTPLIERLFVLLLSSSPRSSFMGVFEMLQLTLQRFELVHWTPKVNSLHTIIKHAYLLYNKKTP